MYNCVVMRERGSDKRDRESLCSGQWWSVLFGVGFMGQRWEAHVGPYRCILGCTQRECLMRRERRGGVTTCCKSRRICGRTQVRMCNSLYKLWPFICVRCVCEGLYLDLWSLLLSLPNSSSATTSSWAERFPYLGERWGEQFLAMLVDIF